MENLTQFLKQDLQVPDWTFTENILHAIGYAIVNGENKDNYLKSYEHRELTLIWSDDSNIDIDKINEIKEEVRKQIEGEGLEILQVNEFETSSSGYAISYIVKVPRHKTGSESNQISE